MKHRSKKVILSRIKSHRTALIKNLAKSLVFYEKITTTEAKAKAVKPYLEKLITIGKKNNLTARRAIYNKLRSELATKKILEVLGPKYQTRPGGYIRIIKLAKTRTDSGKLVLIQFV